jgi:molybdenum cofactor guanylyltransferase
VVACDFPLLNHAAIQQLVSERNPSSIATSFLDEHTLMPEPWITILEPRIYPILEQYHARGKSSLRGILVDYNSTVIRALHPDILLNANTPEEAERLKQIIQS